MCDTNPDEPPPPRYNNWVKYRHKATGRFVFHINFHAVAGIDNNGWPEDLPRTRCAEQQFAEVKELAREKKAEGQATTSTARRGPARTGTGTSTTSISGSGSRAPRSCG